MVRMEDDPSHERYRICAGVDHGGDPQALNIYNRSKDGPYYLNGWVLERAFTHEEAAYLRELVEKKLNEQNITLRLIDVDSLSETAVSIYTTGANVVG